VRTTLAIEPLINYVPSDRQRERKLTFGSANGNELVFVPGKSGRIEFIFSELYFYSLVRPNAEVGEEYFNQQTQQEDEKDD